MREAPSRVLLERLIAEGAIVQAYDPVAMDEARHIYDDLSGLEFCDSADDALTGSQCACDRDRMEEFLEP